MYWRPFTGWYKDGRQWRFSRLSRLATQGEPWPCKRSRVSSGLRSFEHLTKDGKAGLYAKQDAKRKVRTPIHVRSNLTPSCCFLLIHSRGDLLESVELGVNSLRRWVEQGARFGLYRYILFVN